MFVATLGTMRCRDGKQVSNNKKGKENASECFRYGSYQAKQISGVSMFSYFQFIYELLTHYHKCVRFCVFLVMSFSYYMFV